MAYALKQALPGGPPAGAAPSWVNPYQAGLDEATAALNAPQAPMYTEEQARDRKDANRRASRWGLLGVMMGDEGQQKAGGQVLQQALGARQERVTDKGVFDPISGQMVVNPEFARERSEGRQQRLQDLAAGASDRQLSREDTQAFQQAQLQEQIASRNQNAQLQREAMGAQKTQLAEQKGLAQAEKLNNDWNKRNEKDLAAQSSFQNLGAIPDTPAGDISFIYSFMKTLDPDSAVKESEFSIAQNAASFGDKVSNYVRQMQSGNRLNAAQRADMMAAAHAVAQQGQARITQKNKYYEQMAGKYGIDPALVIPAYGRFADAPDAGQASPAPAAAGAMAPPQAGAQPAAAPPRRSAPPVGTRHGEFVYKGGDPASAASWVKG